MFNIKYGVNTEEKFNRVYKNCIIDNCECVINVLGELPMSEFLEILTDVVDGTEIETTNNSISIEYGFGSSLTVDVLSLDINEAVIELKF